MQANRFQNVTDMIDGGGIGQAGPAFEGAGQSGDDFKGGGLLSSLLNTLGGKG